jgi:hypothetical protein
MKRLAFLPLAAATAVLLLGPAAHAEPSVPAPLDAVDAQLAPAPREATVTQKTVRYTTLVVIPLATLAYGQQIWNWGDDHGWTWADEGFFGPETPHGGADKLGHAFSHYTLTRLSTRIFDYTEGDHERALTYGAIMAGSIGLGIEIGDAFNGKYGFSMQDLIADASGIALAVLLELSPTADGLVGFSVEYLPTDRFLADDDKSWLEFEGDTSGWTYLLNFKPGGLRALGVASPRYLDFVTLDVGYYTRGFSWWDRLAPEMQKQRSFFVGVSMNVPEMVDLAFGKNPGVVGGALRQTFSLYHLPLGLKGSLALD